MCWSLDLHEVSTRHTAKCAAYRAIVHPSLEYAAVVCTLHSTGDINLFESLQNRAVQWIRMW